MTPIVREQVELFPSAVKALIEQIEDQLLRKDSGWLAPTIARMKSVLGDLEVRKELRDWLGLATPSRSRDQLSKPVREWLEIRNHRLEATEEAAGYLLDRLPEAGPLGEGIPELTVVLGMQYVVLQYLPGLREFRGTFLQSNLLPDSKLTAVCGSLRVPHERGAVNWMSSLLLREPPERAVPFVATLYDAALDLRGRVAAEDLVLGNRSVSGFVVLSATQNSYSGYFFVSHPVPGIFVGGSGHSEFEKALGEIYEQNSAALANAIEADLMSSFGEATLIRSEEWNQRIMPGLATPPIMSLASESPTGFLAALVATPVRDPMSGRISNWSLSCQINEEPFVSSIWSLLQLTSTFFEAWSDRVARHMKFYAELLSEPNSVPDRFPRMAWLPQFRSMGRSEHVLEFLDHYYPEGAISDLNRWMAERNLGDQWIAWHLSSLRENEKANEDIEKPAHKRLSAALAIYSREEASYADLVVPILGREKKKGPTRRERVVGFLRFNCDPGPMARGGRSVGPREDLEKFRNLYRIIREHLPRLDNSVGVLFAWTDLQLQRLLVKPEQSRIRAYKQTSDAARVLADWIVSYLSGVLSGAKEDGHSRFEIVRHVFAYLSAHTIDGEPEGADDWSTAELERVLEGIQEVFAQIGRSLAAEELPAIPTITFWLQTSRPVIEILPFGDGSSGDLTILADLFERDPGLPQLLSYLSFAQAWSPDLVTGGEHLDLLSRIRIGPNNSSGTGELQVYREGMSLHDFTYLLDLGVPPKDSRLTRLEILPAGTLQKKGWLTLCWQLDDSGDLKKVNLRSSWSQESTAAQFHPYPAAVQHVQWMVSQRVGSVVTQNARIQILKDLNSPRKGILLSLAFESGTIERGLEEKLAQLEDALLGPASGRAYWRALPLPREGFLFMLASSGPTSAMVEAFRATALAYERGAYLAWILGEDTYQDRSMSERLAAIGHGYTGPVGHLRHEMMMTKTLWDSLESLDTERVSRSMREFINQASAIIKLGGAAIQFARMEVVDLQFETLSGSSILDQIRLVASAYQPREEGVISLSLDDERLNAFEAQLVPLIFIHGLSKLLDNAVKAARAPLTPSSGTTARVLLAARLKAPNLIVEIANSGAQLTEEGFRCIRRGLLTGNVDDFLREPQLRPPLGLREAWKCFEKLNINVEVERGNAPFIISIKLELRKSH